ncbi:MAG: hypothetical protein IPL12_12225 [Bacteroidetes bacterium]|nr:hypothetical protein [Bacteroidota bacterium]
MKTIKPTITILLLIISGALYAQNPVTFIPPDPAKGGPRQRGKNRYNHRS